MEKIFIKGEWSIPQRGDGVKVGEVHVQKTDDVSDGYHTFGELYDHRITLFIALCHTYWAMTKTLNMLNRTNNYCAWRSKAHHPEDSAMYDGWFILGMNVDPGRQITYHLPLSRWEETNFAETLDHAPKWDGHTPADVLERLKNL